MSFSHITRADNEKIIRIGAGGLLEGHYNTGLKLCRYISISNNNIKCQVVPTHGSLESLELLKLGKIDFAFVLSNFAMNSYKGTGYFAGTKPFKDMYQLLRLHDESFTVIVKDDDRILSFVDLDGRKISNGPPSSDSSVIYNALEPYYDFKNIPIDIEIAYEYYAKLFCNGKIDAIMIMTGHPSALVNLIAHSCEIDFAVIDSEKIDLLIKNNPGFHKVILEAGKYPGITEAQETIATPAIFVASASVDRDIVENFMSYFRTKIIRFKDNDPLLSDLEDSHFMSKFVLPDFNGNIEE
jgi:TRAP transporter TAXI family solute receptor